MLTFLRRNEDEDEDEDEDDSTQETMTGDNLPLNAFGAIVGISRSEEADLPPRLEIEHRL
jgi:hypothetical protein